MLKPPSLTVQVLAREFLCAVCVCVLLGCVVCLGRSHDTVQSQAANARSWGVSGALLCPTWCANLSTLVSSSSESVYLCDAVVVLQVWVRDAYL